MSKAMKNPWTTLSVTEKYDNAWIKVTHREVLNPAGNPGIYGMVEVKNLAIAIVPLDEYQNTWLVGQYRYPMEAYSWEIPEGGGLIGTPPLASAQRELQEETGITARKWQEIGELALSNCITDERAVIFLAQDLAFGESSPEETEQLIVKKMPFEKVVEMVMKGEITDALSVAAILKVNMLIMRGVV